MDGTVWSTDKDGFILNLLAAEILAKTGKDPGQHYKELAGRFGNPIYERTDSIATPEQRKILSKLSPDEVPGDTLVGDRILAKLTEAQGNGARIGGIKVVAEQSWFAVRPSGTEDVYKIYTESFRGKEHLQQIQQEVKAMIEKTFRSHGV